MKKVQMKNKGITLVALVVTIIILLILAGITISQLTGNGLFENAKLAEQKSKEAQEKEEETLADYENKIGEYVDGTRDSNSYIPFADYNNLLYSAKSISTNLEYTATENCWVYILGRGNTNENYIHFSIDNSEYLGMIGSGSLTYSSATYLLEKGSTIKCSVTGSSVIYSLNVYGLK